MSTAFFLKIFDSEDLKKILHQKKKGVQHTVHAFKAWAKKNGAIQYSYWLSPACSFKRQFFDIECLDKASLQGKEMQEGTLSWDFISPPFVMEDEEGTAVFYIPALFEETQRVDYKISLMKAEEKFEELLIRLSYLIGLEKRVEPIFEIEEPFSHEPGFEETVVRLGKGFKTSQKTNRPNQNFAVSSSDKGVLAVEKNTLLMHLIEQMGASSHFDGKKIHWRFSCTGSEKQIRQATLLLMTAMIYAIYQHGSILAASSGSFKDAAPSLEIDLGEEGERLLFGEVQKRKSETKRVPFCVFNGDGFSFEGFPSYSYPGFALCTLIASFADSLQLILDESERLGNHSDLVLLQLRKRANEAYCCDHLEKSLVYRFDPIAVQTLLAPKSVRCFEKIVDEKDLAQIQLILLSQYNDFMYRKMREMANAFRNQMLPDCLLFFTKLQTEIPREVSIQIEKAIVSIDGLDRLQEEIKEFGLEAQAKALFQLGREKLLAASKVLDALNAIYSRLNAD